MMLFWNRVEWNLGGLRKRNDNSIKTETYLHGNGRFNETCNNNSVWSYLPKEERLRAKVMFG